jgi:NAD(P)-dependent dehydrogenase (short-subunit alcohol dehydrogenase family)
MSQKVWLITGCSSGFGAALAREVLSRGDAVIATARDPAKLTDLKDAGASTLALDVTSPLPELKATAEEAFKIHNRIDYLINNAGYNQVGGLEELTPHQTQAQFDTNVFGLLNVTRAVLPYMRSARSGVIANISSVMAWSRLAGIGLYCASKWCVSGLSESMNLELKEFGIKVCSIEPGIFRSNFLGDAAKGRANTIEDYEGTEVRKGEGLMEALNGQQPGDVKKGARVIVDVLAEKTGKPVPLRLVIGSDAYAMIKGAAEEVLTVLEESKELTFSTDLDSPEKSRHLAGL